jgi:hypothetical protein
VRPASAPVPASSSCRVFDQGVDGRVCLIEQEPDEELQAAALDAVANCPVGAISVVETSPAGATTAHQRSRGLHDDLTRRADRSTT